MSCAIRITASAMEDLVNISKYIAEESQSVEMAENAAQKILNTAELLMDTPYAGHVPKSRAIRLRGYRVLACGVYLIFYRCDEPQNTVTLHRILHSKQDYQKLI